MFTTCSSAGNPEIKQKVIKNSKNRKVPFPFFFFFYNKLILQTIEEMVSRKFSRNANLAVIYKFSRNAAKTRQLIP